MSIIERLRAVLVAVGPTPESEIAALEQKVGPVPALLRQVYTDIGIGEIEVPHTVTFYGLEDIASFLDDYAELKGLIPFASDGGAWDFCWITDAVEEPGLLVGGIVLVSRGDRSFEGMIPVGRDTEDFFQRRMLGQDPFELPNLGTHWTRGHKVSALPLGVRAEQVHIVSLHYRTLSPSELRPIEDVEICGLPCKAGKRVTMTVLGELISCILARDADIHGVRCKGGHEVVLRGGLHRFTPVEPIELAGILWAGGEPITLPYGQLAQRSGTLAEPITLDGIALAADAVRLDQDLRVLMGTTTASVVIDGLAVPSGARFERMIPTAGEPRLFSIRSATAWTCMGQSIEPGVRFYPHEHR